MQAHIEVIGFSVEFKGHDVQSVIRGPLQDLQVKWQIIVEIYIELTEKIRSELEMRI